MKKKNHSRRQQPRKPFKLGFETLEDRRLLAGMTSSLHEDFLALDRAAQLFENTTPSAQIGQASAALSAAVQSTVLVNFTAEASTVIGTPFGHTEAQIRGRIFSGSFSYDTSTPATVVNATTADYNHVAGTGSFTFNIDGTTITGSGAPVFRIVNRTGSSDQFQFADGSEIESPFTPTTMFVNGAANASVGVSLNISDSGSPLSTTALPDPFPYDTASFNIPHTFPLRADSNNFILLQIRNIQQTVADTFRVTQLTPTPTGFEAEFNADIDAALLSLYSTTPNGAGASDITLVGASVGAVSGSVVVDSSLNKITFIKTGGPLAPDDYTLTLRSAANGLVDIDGNLLDGNSDGTAGDHYVNTFNIAVPVGAVTVGLPDFARGPGQPIVVPTSAAGLPLTLSDAAGVTDVTFDLSYDQALFHIASAQPAAGMPAGSTVTLDTSTVPGIATITFHSPTALTAGAKTFVVLQAGVPNAATYRSTQVLEFSGLLLNGGAIEVVADDALQVVDLFGDANGDQQYTGFDASRISRVVVGLDSGFLPFVKVDPKIIADINSDANLTGFDASRVSRVVVGLPVTQIPALPAPNAAPSFTKGADQNISPDSGPQSVADWATNISAGSAAEVGQSLTFQVTDNTNAALFSAAPQVSPDGTLTYTTAAGATGSATITLVLKDDGGTAGGGVDTSAAQTFVITVGTANQAPFRTAGNVNNLVVLEDSDTTSLGLNGLLYSPGGGVNEAGQVLSYRITAAPPATLGTILLADKSTVVSATEYYSISQIRNMLFRPAANQSGGPWAFSFAVKDDGGTAGGGLDTLVESLTITVTDINDTPTFIAGGNQTVVAGPGVKSVAGWATNIAVGPAGEVAQTPAFSVVQNSNPALFSVAPSVSPTGTLSYVLAGTPGSARITVALTDNGGTANGGDDTSLRQSFTITALQPSSGGAQTPVAVADAYTVQQNGVLLANRLRSGLVSANIAANAIIAESYGGMAFAAIGANGGAIANSLTEIDPGTGAIGQSYFLDSEPTRMVVSDDGRTIFVVTNGDHAYHAFDVVTRTVGPKVFMPGTGQDARLIRSIEAVPGTNDTIVVSLRVAGVSPPAAGTRVYKAGAELPDGIGTGPGVGGPDIVTVDDTGKTVYGYTNTISSFAFVIFSIDSTGVHYTNPPPPGSPFRGYDVGTIKAAKGKLYNNRGEIAQVSDMNYVGSFLGGDNFVLDPSGGFLYSIASSGTTHTIRQYTLATNELLQTITLNNIAGTATNLGMIGSNGLTFRTATQVYFVDLRTISSTGTSAPLSQVDLLQTLNNPSPVAEEFFGVGDVYGDFVLTGASRHSSGQGQAYLFNANTGALLKTFNDPTPASGDFFGHSVALHGNLALVSSVFHDYGTSYLQSDVGQAHLFNASTGALIRTFEAPVIARNSFGNQVAISDKYSLIGASNRQVSDGGTGFVARGQAHLYDLATGALLHTFEDPDTTTRKNFGHSVAISENYVLISQSLDGATSVGKAFLFDAVSGNLLRTFNNPSPTGDDQFGSKVAIDGNNVVIACVGDDTGASNAGTVYLFDAVSGNLLRTFNNPDPDAQDSFGGGISIQGNLLAIGAADDTVGLNVGQVYLFDVASGKLLKTINDPTPTTQDVFGSTTAIDGNRIFVTALGDDLLGSNVGQAYLFKVTFDKVPIPTGVLANDSDPDGDTLTPNVVQNVQHGTLGLGADGTFSYVPEANYVGTDTFTYTVSDGVHTSAPATVTITVTQSNTVPVARNDAYTVNPGATLTIGQPASAVLALTLPTKGSVYDANSNLIWAAVGSTGGSRANSLTAINPLTGAIGASFPLGTEPSRLVISGDSRTVFVVTNNNHAIVPFDTLTQTFGEKFFLNGTGQYAEQVKSIEPVPGTNDSVLVSQYYAGFSPPAARTVIYRGGKALPQQIGSGLGVGGPDIVTINEFGNRVYGYTNSISSFSFTQLLASPTGLVGDPNAVPGSPFSGFNVGTIKVAAEKIYNNKGEIAQLSDLNIIANFLGGANFVLDPASGSLFSLESSGTTHTLRQYSLATNALLESVAITNIAGTTSGLTVLGGGRIAFATSNNNLIIVDVPRQKSGLLSGVLGNDTDADNQSLTAILGQNVQHGTLLLNPNGTFTYTPTAGYSGTDSFTYTANDGLINSSPATVTFTVLPAAANTAPSFTKGPNLTVAANQGPQTFAAWAKDIVPGLIPEAGQTVSFQLSGNTNPGLFTVAPTISANGTLTFTPSGTTGTAKITVVAKDSGGTANGGQDTSFAHAFTITIAPVNTAPQRTAGTVANLQVAKNANLTSLGLELLGYNTGSGAAESTQALRFTVTTVPSSTVGDVVLADGKTVVVAGWMYTLEQLRTMKFRAAVDQVGGPVVFSFSVKDDGGAAPGNSDTLLESLTIQLLDGV